MALQQTEDAMNPADATRIINDVRSKQPNRCNRVWDMGLRVRQTAVGFDIVNRETGEPVARVAANIRHDGEFGKKYRLIG